MSDYLLELEVRLKGENVLDRFEGKAIATGKKIEQALANSFKLASSQLKLSIDTSGIKNAAGEMRLLNREIAEAIKGMKAIGLTKLPKAASGGSSGGSGNVATAAAVQRALNAELKRQQSELSLIAKLERDVASARVAGAKSTGNKALVETITLEKEALRHAQLLAKINASPLSPKAATEARNLATALNSINVNKIKSEFAGLESQASKTFGKISNLAANVAGGVSGAVTSAGLNVAGNVIGGTINAVTGTIGDSASQALDFNSTLNMIKINTQATTESMTTLRAAVLEASTAFGIAPTQVAGLSLELARMGVNAQQLPEYLNAIGNSARASGEDFGTVKDIIASTKAVFTDLSVANVGDLLTVGANISPEGFQAIGQALSYVSANAKDAGVPLSQLIEQIVILQSAGMRSDRAGTSLSALYTDIKENAGVIEELGVEVFDSSGKLREMSTIIAEVGTKLSTMSKEEKALTLKPFDTNSTRALETLGQAYQDNAAKVKEYRTALEGANGVSVSQGAEALLDPKAKVAQALARVDQLKIKLGETFTPAIEGATDFGIELGDALLNNDALFAGLTQSSNEFQAYLAANPQLVTDMATALGEVGVILSQTVLTETRKLLEYLQQNPAAIQQALTGMVDFASNLAAAVKFAADLVGYLRQAFDFGGKVFNNLASLVPGQKELWAQQEQQQASGGSGDAVSQGVAMAINAVKQSESFRGQSYNDGTGVQTIGYGETRPDVVARGTITEPEAAKLLEQRIFEDYLKPALALIPDAIRQKLSAGQIAAIASFTYNTGVGGFQDSSFGKALISGNVQGAAAALPTSYINPGSNVEQGLRNRRQGELALFNSGGSSPTAAASTAPPIPSLSDRADEFKVTVGGQTMTFAEYQQRQSAAVNAPVAAPSITVDSVGIRTMSGQEYGASRDGGSRAHAGEDFDLAAGQNSTSYLGGVVQEIQDWGSYGKAAVIYNSKLGMTEIVAEMKDVFVQVGQTIEAGTAVGSGGNDVAGVQHEEIHRGQGRTGDTVAPLEYLRSIGADPAKGTVYAGNDGTSGGNGLTRLDRALTPKERQAQRDESAQKKEEADRQRLVQQARANEDQALQLQRQQAQSQRQQESQSRRLSIQTSTAGLAGTPFEVVGQRQLSAFDLRDKYQQEIDKYKQDLEDLQRELARLDSRKGEPGIQAVIDGYKGAIAQTQSYISTLGEQYQEESNLLELANSQAIAQDELAVRSEMAAGRSARAAATMALEVEAFIGTIKDPTLQAFLRSGFEQESKGNSYAEEIRKVEEEAAKLEAAIKALQDSGLDLNSPELQLSQEKLADLRDTMVELRNNRDLELKVSVKGQADLLQQFKTNQQSQITQARVNVLQQRGDVFGANALQRTDATQQQAASYFDQRSSIEALRGTAQEGEIPGLMANLEELNEFSLQGINNEFLTLNETMAQTAQGALKGFISDLGKGKGFADSFTSAIDNLAGSLLDMVLNQAFSSLFGGGGMGGGLGGAGGGGIAGIVTQGLSGLAFHEGNVPNFAKGSPIDEAFRREKAAGAGRPYLAVFNDKEIILSAKQSETFMDLGLNKVVNMAGGNVPTANKSGMGAINLSMPISLSVGGEDGNAPPKGKVEDFASGLQKQMQAIAFAEIAKARRPNGQLWGR